MNVKKLWLFIIAILALFLVGGFLFLRANSRIEKELVDSLQYSPENKEATSSAQKECDQSHTIEYLYYSKPDKIRNNKVGIYIYAENKDFFELADQMVNSNGGDWGYVLIPYNVKDRDREKWSRAFSLALNKHLIPIVQLWDVDPNKYEEQTKDAAEFLDSFIWPVKQRYISVYNEPNDAKFWRGKLDPSEYAHILRYTIAIFRKENLDFFMLNGAFNSSAGNTNETMDSEQFMKKMNEAVPGIFNDLDGWASHSYPQPNFSGSVDDEGRWSIRAYQEELRFLKDELGVKKNLPVFITETGWAHTEGETFNPAYLSVKKVSENIKKAYEKVWLPDDRVMAVTPFTIWYEPPFDHFSWVNRDKTPYEVFFAVKSIKKVKGTPEKMEVGRISSPGCAQ